MLRINRIWNQDFEIEIGIEIAVPRQSDPDFDPDPDFDLEEKSFQPEGSRDSQWLAPDPRRREVHEANSSAWADATLRRLKSWKFTTLGGWSHFATLRRSPEQALWLTPVLRE